MNIRQYLRNVLITWALFLLLLALPLGCAIAKYQIHQGAISIGNDAGSFDSHTADFLSEERAFLDSFKGKTEPKLVTEALEYAEKQYQITKASYLAWRATQTADTLAKLNQDKTALTGAIGQVSQAQAQQPQGGGK